MRDGPGDVTKGSARHQQRCERRDRGHDANDNRSQNAAGAAQRSVTALRAVFALGIDILADDDGVIDDQSQEQ